MSRNIRVLHLGKFYDPFKGGIELVTKDLVEVCNEKGVTSDVLCFAHDGVDCGYDSGFEYTVYRASSFAGLGSARFSLDFFRQLRAMVPHYDFVHLHLPNPMAHLALWACRPKAKIILHWHSDIVKQKFFWFIYRPFVRSLIKKSAAVIGATSAHLESSDFSKVFKDMKCQVIPYLFDFAKFDSIPPNSDSIKGIKQKFGSRRIIFSIGRHVYYKGFGDLINAAKFLPDDYVVAIGGSGADTDKLQQQIYQEGLQGKVYMLGRLSNAELINYLDACDVFVLSSNFRSEMFGMVQLESFARSTPVVCTKISGSGVHLVGNDGATGLVVDVNSPSSIAAAVQEIIEGNSYKSFCNNAREWLDLRYNRDELITRYTSLYRTLLVQESAD